MPEPCEHPSTTLSEDWKWVNCAVCGEPVKPNPAVDPPMGYCAIMKDGREYHPSAGRRSPQ